MGPAAAAGEAFVIIHRQQRWQRGAHAHPHKVQGCHLLVQVIVGAQRWTTARCSQVILQGIGRKCRRCSADDKNDNDNFNNNGETSMGEDSRAAGEQKANVTAPDGLILCGWGGGGVSHGCGGLIVATMVQGGVKEWWHWGGGREGISHGRGGLVVTTTAQSNANKRWHHLAVTRG